MKREEFTTFLQEFATMFPHCGSAIKNFDSPKATVDSWYPAFKSYDLSDALRVLPLMRDSVGSYAPLLPKTVEAFPRVIPKYIRNLAWSMHEDRQRKIEARGNREVSAWGLLRGKDPGMTREFKRLLNAREEVEKERDEAGLPPLHTTELNQLAITRMGGIQL